MPLIDFARRDIDYFQNLRNNDIPINANDLDIELNDIQDYINNKLNVSLEAMVVNQLRRNKITGQILGISLDNQLVFDYASKFLDYSNIMPVNKFKADEQNSYNLVNGNFINGDGKNSIVINMTSRGDSILSTLASETKKIFIIRQNAQYALLDSINSDDIRDNQILNDKIQDKTLLAEHLINLPNSNIVQDNFIEAKHVQKDAITSNKFSYQLFNIYNPPFSIFIDENNQYPEKLGGLSATIRPFPKTNNLTPDKFADKQIDRRNFFEYVGDGELKDNVYYRNISNILSDIHFKDKFVDDGEWFNNNLGNHNNFDYNQISNTFKVTNDMLPKFNKDENIPFSLNIKKLGTADNNIYFFGYHPLDFDDEVIQLLKKKNCFYND